MQEAMRTAQIFDEENIKDSGGETLIVLNDRVYFANGCWRELNPLGVRATLRDPYKKAGMSLFYWQLRLKEKSEEFNELKLGLLNHTRAATQKKWADPGPSEKHIARLKALKKEVLKLQAKVQAAHKAYEDAKPQELRDREQQDAEIRRECEQAFETIRGIEV